MVKRYLSADLLIIDDMGLKGLPQVQGVLFEIIMRRYGVKVNDNDHEQAT